MSIDRIPIPRGTGAMWLCGRNDIGPDPEAALQRAGGATVAVCLNPIGELQGRYPAYVEWLRANLARRAIWFPIGNFSAPSARSVLPIVRTIVERLDGGDGVVIHCAAGQGRAGTLACCVLIAMGEPVDAAVRTVAAHRVFAGPGSAAQWSLVDELAGLLAAD